MKATWGLTVGILAALGAVSEAAEAQEQVWLRNPMFLEGMGYRVGDLELHPGVAGEFGYDSNMFLRAPIEDPVAVYRVRLTPSLSVSTLSEQRRAGGNAQMPSAIFKATVAGTYNEYIAAEDTEEDISQFRNVGALADFQLDIMPGRQWGAVLSGNLTRTVQPSNLSDTSFAYNRIHGAFGGEIIWAPGGGLFDWRFGYNYATEYFEASQFKGLNNGTHTLNTRGRWRFLPRTAMMFDASQSFARYSDTGASNYLLDSDPLRVRLGFTGLVTQRVSLLALGGWGATFHKPGAVPIENYDGPIGQAQLTFYPTAAPGLAEQPREATLVVSQIGLGYTRDFANSYFGGFYTRDRGYLTASYFFAGRLLVSTTGGISRVHFPRLYFPTDATGAVAVRANSFNDTRYDATLFAEYRLSGSFGLNSTVSYEQNDSRRLPTGATAADFDDLSYKHFQAFIGARWFM